MLSGFSGGRARNAKIAQLVEHDLAKVGVAGSSPVFRSRLCSGGGPDSYRDGRHRVNLKNVECPGGGIGRHAGLKILWPLGCAGSSPAPGTTPIRFLIGFFV